MKLYLVAMSVYDTKVYLSDGNMCLLNNEQLPNGVLWVIVLQILALIRK